jgi:hypothetical protein
MSVIAMASLVACADDDDGPPSSTTTTPTTTAPTTAPTTTAPTTTAPTTSAPETGPARVSLIRAQRSAGSGELEVVWDAVAGATGYRVERAGAPDAPFSVAADVDLAAGTATAADGVTNVYTDMWSYRPQSAGGSPPPVAEGAEFHYIEVAATRTYFRVTAYDGGVDAPASAVVCAAPSSSPSC